MQWVRLHFWKCNVYCSRRASGSTKGVIIGLCAALILLISISRVYLGVHYPTDIIAGIIGGAFCIVLSTLVLKGLHEPTTL